jgi:hypothetical protein
MQSLDYIHLKHDDDIIESSLSKKKKPHGARMHESGA